MEGVRQPALPAPAQGRPGAGADQSSDRFVEAGSRGRVGDALRWAASKVASRPFLVVHAASWLATHPEVSDLAGEGTGAGHLKIMTDAGDG